MAFYLELLVQLANLLSQKSRSDKQENVCMCLGVYRAQVPDSNSYAASYVRTYSKFQEIPIHAVRTI